MDVSEFNQWADGNPLTLLSVTPDDTGGLELFVAYWLEPGDTGATPSDSLPPIVRERASAVEFSASCLRACDRGDSVCEFDTVTVSRDASYDECLDALYEGLEQRDSGRSCHVCGGSLEGQRGDAVTCSHTCRQKAYRVRKRAA